MSCEGSTKQCTGVVGIDIQSQIEVRHRSGEIAKGVSRDPPIGQGFGA